MPLPATPSTAVNSISSSSRNLDASAKIPIIVCIDVEPDGFYIDRTKKLPWKGYEACVSFFSQLRPKLEKATGSPVHFSWFHRMDPQVADVYGSPDWPITHYPEFSEELIRNGDEMGLHPHAYRWEPAINEWIVDHGNQNWVNHCVDMSFSAYKKAFGRGCESFRFGERWMSNETMDLIEKKGIKFDLTIEPGLKEIGSYHPTKPFTGSLPDYTEVPRYPYKPSEIDFRKPDFSRNTNLWVIPFSTAMITYKFGRTEWLYRRIFAPQFLKPRISGLIMNLNSIHFISVVEDALRSLDKPYLMLAMRSHVAAIPRLLKNIEENCQYLLTHKLRHRFVVSTPQETAEILGLKKELVYSK